MTTSAPRSSAAFASTIAVTMLSVATVALLGRLFDGDAFVRPTLVLVLGVHAIAMVLRWSRLPAVLTLPALGVAGAALAAGVLYRSTLFGPLPTGATLEAVGADLRYVLDHFATAIAPVPDRGAFASMTALAMGVAAALADTFAFRASGRIEVVVPSAVMVLLVAALGNGDMNVVATATWFATALLTMGVLRVARWSEAAILGGRHTSWQHAVPIVLALAVVCAVVAGAVGPRLPGVDSAPLVEPGTGGDSVTEVVSPLVGLDARLTSEGSVELFTVSSSDGPHYWRAMALDTFDGVTWSPAPESLSTSGEDAASAMNDVAGERVDQVITIAGLAGHLVPAAHVAVDVAPDSVLFAPRSESLVMPDVEVQRGDVLTVRSRVLTPTIGQLRATTVAHAPALSMYSVPDVVPESVRSEAFTIAATATTAYDRAIALQDWFREFGGFTYDLDVDYGNSATALTDFLDRRRGFCQQFATAFATMARIVGLPTRVVVGFTPGDVDASGTFHVFGRHAHAWPEVWFDGMGWVAFEPTPGRGSPDGVGYLPGVVPAQDQSGASPDPTDTTAPDDTRPATSTTAAVADPATTLPDGAPATTVRSIDTATETDPSGDAATTLAVVVVVILVTAAAVLAARRTRRSRPLSSPSAAVEHAWATACRALRLAGVEVPAGATPTEFAQVASAAVGVDAALIAELAELVTSAAYEPSPVDVEQANRGRELAAMIRTQCLATAPALTRLRSAIADRFE